MTCHACKGDVIVDEQNTHAVCPWCGALTQGEQESEPDATALLACRCQGHAHNALADRHPAPNGYCLQCPCTTPPVLAADWPGLGEKWRPWCCPEPRCTPVHTLSGSEEPLSVVTPGETFVCFGSAPTVEFVYDGVKHVNDARSCTYTALKGVISYQENADDWRALSSAYNRAEKALLRLRNGDQGARNA